MVAHWYLKVEAMRLLTIYIRRSNIPSSGLTGSGGPELWLNRTPHVVVSAPTLGDGSLCGFEIGP